MSPTDSPSGESETLEERLFPFSYVGGGYFRHTGVPQGKSAEMLHGDQVVSYLRESYADKIVRLTAEVARLTAEREEDIRWLLDVGFWRSAHLDGCASVRLDEPCDCRLGIIRERYAHPCRTLTTEGGDRAE